MFKLVRESLEPLHFQRGLDPKHAMGIGKYAMIKAWLDEMGVEDYTINDDYTIDVDGHVNLYFRNLDKFPDYIQFGKVSGIFACDHNKLTSLRGAPKTVGDSFFCGSNKLTSLRGVPVIINGSFSCRNNELTSLEYAPQFVKKRFYCEGNKRKFTEKEVRLLCKVEMDISV